MKDKIVALIKESMKNKDTVALETYRAISAAFVNAEKLNGVPPNDAEQVAILKKLAKTRKESAEIYVNNDRLSLAAKEMAELAIIDALLPTSLSAEDAEDVITNWISNNSEVELTKRNMGVIVKAVVAESNGTIDGKTASTIVKKILDEQEAVLNSMKDASKG